MRELDGIEDVRDSNFSLALGGYMTKISHQDMVFLQTPELVVCSVDDPEMRAQEPRDNHPWNLAVHQIPVPL